jgi:threonine aldolase
VSALAAPVNTVAVSLNKGLCAPMGTILAGRTPVIELAHRTLRRLGGASVHKAGIAAAAALVALDTLVDRLADDHRRARELGALLQQIPGVEVQPAEIETNIVLVDVSGTELFPEEFLRLLAERGVLGMERDTNRVRFVTHRLIGDAEIAEAAEIVAALAAEHVQSA